MKSSLNKLTRADLLRTVLHQREKLDALLEENRQLKETLEKRTAVIASSASLADAIFTLSGLDDMADYACELYAQALPHQPQSADVKEEESSYFEQTDTDEQTKPYGKQEENPDAQGEEQDEGDISEQNDNEDAAESAPSDSNTGFRKAAAPDRRAVCRKENL